MEKRKVIELPNEANRVAEEIGNMWQQWDDARAEWKAHTQEVREYVFSTDTSTTANNSLPWKNKTTIPKLCQIRDNLHANYMAALMPNDNWFDWEALGKDGVSKEKKESIKAYMQAKTRTSPFEETLSRLVLDYIDYGNAFADVVYTEETYVTADGEQRISYAGPRLVRISPNDIVFDPTARDFTNAPKVVRTYYTMGELEQRVANEPNQEYLQEALEMAKADRMHLRSAIDDDLADRRNLEIAGLGHSLDYYMSGLVEVLEFEGDVYTDEEYQPNRIVTVIDRRHVLRNIANPAWNGRTSKVHVGWRQRPGNLMAMGPLDNLVGMQYRIDHIENLRADAFDMIAFPVMKIKGDVEDFDYKPAAKIYCDEDGDVDFMHPDVTVLQADTQIAILEQKMEEMAGAPKQAMGFRTPGEKTAYEVQVLENGASRVFQSKINYFERNFLEPALNNMLEVSRRNMTSEVIKVVGNDGAEIFQSITMDDLRADGMLRPIGARHFTEKAQAVQNLSQFFNSAMGQDPSITVHFSGVRLAKAVEELLNLQGYDLVQENVRLEEQATSQQLAQRLSQDAQRRGMIDPQAEPIEEEVMPNE